MLLTLGLSLGFAGGCSRTGAPQTTQCTEGLVSCGGTCVDVERDPLNCGSCGVVCEESDICVAGQCASFCPDGWQPCGTSAADCADLQSDHDNCGGCGNDCGDLVCDAGSCVGSCSAGRTECAGSCVDTQTNPAHCGACGAACDIPGAVPACEDGICQVGECLPGRLDCDGDPANGCEVDALGDSEHCGACEGVCPSGPNAEALCEEGVCGLACAPGFADCDQDPTNGCEVPVDRDSANCGACGNSCDGRTCEAGQCTDTCAPGTQDCGGEQCVDVLSDPDNCGGCGRVCALPNAQAACAAGQCAVAQCTTGFGDCDGDPSNGCEVSLDSDDWNCGSCGNTCAPGIRCDGGVCQSPGVLCGGVTCPAPQLCCLSGGGMGGSSLCYDPSSQVCAGSTLACDGASDCGPGEVCCQDASTYPAGAACAASCETTVLCSQSADCPSAAPFCCAVYYGMTPTNQCSPDPC